MVLTGPRPGEDGPDAHGECWQALSAELAKVNRCRRGSRTYQAVSGIAARDGDGVVSMKGEMAMATVFRGKGEARKEGKDLWRLALAAWQVPQIMRRQQYMQHRHSRARTGTCWQQSEGNDTC